MFHSPDHSLLECWVANHYAGFIRIINISLINTNYVPKILSNYACDEYFHFFNELELYFLEFSITFPF